MTSNWTIVATTQHITFAVARKVLKTHSHGYTIRSQAALTTWRLDKIHLKLVSASNTSYVIRLKSCKSWTDSLASQLQTFLSSEKSCCKTMSLSACVACFRAYRSVRDKEAYMYIMWWALLIETKFIAWLWCCRDHYDSTFQIIANNTNEQTPWLLLASIVNTNRTTACSTFWLAMANQQRSTFCCPRDLVSSTAQKSSTSSWP